LETDRVILPFVTASSCSVCQFGSCCVKKKKKKERSTKKKTQALARVNPIGLKLNGFSSLTWGCKEAHKLGTGSSHYPAAFIMPPTFYHVLFSYHNRSEISRILKQAGFGKAKLKLYQNRQANRRRCGQSYGRRESRSGNDCEGDPSYFPSSPGRAAAITRRFGERDVRAPIGDCGPGPRLTNLKPIAE